MYLEDIQSRRFIVLKEYTPNFILKGRGWAKQRILNETDILKEV